MSSKAADPTISIVINTYNRAPSLRQTLASLRYQVFDRFEVVVVNGPSTDDTETVLADFAGRIRVARCPAVNLSKSRNVGIAAASGDVVAFLDDDAIPDPYWLVELAAGYHSERVAGVGGVVYDYTGYAFQFAASVTDRVCSARYDVKPPYWGYLLPGGDLFLHLQGTNASFRRRCLEEIGGFDEEIEYFLDETEVCLQLVDRGYQLRLLDCAAVYHKFLPSHLRNERKIFSKPFPAVKNKCYVALRSRLPGTSVEDVLAQCQEFADRAIKEARTFHFWGALTTAELVSFEEDVDRALWIGIGKGLSESRKSGRIPAACPEHFLPFPRLTPPTSMLNICFVCEAPPAEDATGVGRTTRALAQDIAALGHEVHFITRSPDHNRVDFEDGVWVHRLQPEQEGPWSGAELSSAVKAELALGAAVHKEVRRIRQWRRIDLVSVPLPGYAGLYCLQDDDLTCVLTLHPIPGEAAPTPAESAQRFCLDDLALCSAQHIHSLGSGPLDAFRRHGRRADTLPVCILPVPAAEGAGVARQDFVRHTLRAYEDVRRRRRAS